MAKCGRHLIGVAQGVLTQRYGMGMDQAFETLQRYSSHANIKLRDLATYVVEEGGLPLDYEGLSARGPLGSRVELT